MLNLAITRAGAIKLAGTGQLNLGTGAPDETTWFIKSGNNLVNEQLGSIVIRNVDGTATAPVA